MTITVDGANALVSVLAGLSGLSGSTVQLGVPEVVGPRVSAYVVAASQIVSKKGTGVTLRDIRYNCVLAYRVDAAVATAESDLMGILDDFIDALNADLTLGKKCQGAEIDLLLADVPVYYIRAGKEFREYPILVTLRQYGAFNPSP